MHFSIIGDKSFINKNEKEWIRNKLMDSYIKGILPNIQKFSQSIKVFQPDNILILLFFNVLVLSLTIIIAFYEMILSSFNGFDGVEILTPGYEIFRKFSSSIFFLEIIIRFNTGAYREGITIFDRQTIFKNYGKFQLFWIDLIISLALVVNIQNYILSLVVFLFRSLKIWRLS